jgi:SSS family solute:Na+ symporter
VKNKSDRHYLLVGRLATVIATLLSIATAYIVLQFNNLMDYVQLLFSFFNAPLFATFLLGMFTRSATPAGGLAGLVAGTLAAFVHYLCVRSRLLQYGSDMTANFYGAMAGCGTCLVVTLVASAFTKKKSAAELKGLVYDRRSDALTRTQAGKITVSFACAIILVLVFLNWKFY